MYFSNLIRSRCQTWVFSTVFVDVSHSFIALIYLFIWRALVGKRPFWAQPTDKNGGLCYREPSECEGVSWSYTFLLAPRHRGGTSYWAEGLDEALGGLLVRLARRECADVAWNVVFSELNRFCHFQRQWRPRGHGARRYHRGKTCICSVYFKMTRTTWFSMTDEYFVYLETSKISDSSRTCLNVPDLMLRSHSSGLKVVPFHGAMKLISSLQSKR